MEIFNRRNKNSNTKTTAMRTIITEGSFLKGNFIFKYNVSIGGVLEGLLNIDLDLSVTKTGVIKGDIKANSVVVHGKVYGDIEANQVEIHKGGLVIGDIRTLNMNTHSGAIFDGRCSIIDSEYKQTVLKIRGVNSLMENDKGEPLFQDGDEPLVIESKGKTKSSKEKSI